MPIQKNPPKSVAAETQALAATGHSKRGIASYFGVSYEIFERWMDDDAELRECFANGRENERLQLHAALFNKAMKGDGPSAMFLLKSRHGYREGDQSEQSNKVQITFNFRTAIAPHFSQQDFPIL